MGGFKMIIGLIGFEFTSPNKGVEALGYSFVSMLSEIIDDAIFYNFDSTDVSKIQKSFKSHTFFKVKPSLKDISLNYFRKLQKCDVIFDVTFGDSFSDIYSIKLYKSYILRKKIAQFFNKFYILLPQTYGPFNSRKSRILAKKVFQNAFKIYCRDDISKNLIEDAFSLKNVELTSDMAFYLPFDSEKFLLNETRKVKIGINISGLLYKGGFLSDNQFGLTIDYQKYIKSLISHYSNQTEYQLYLIPHVIDTSENSYDDDYKVSKLLELEYSNIIVAEEFDNPVDAKSFISKMDIFIGSRMHSTIAAFSSNVITIPVSYSRKFEGLYNSIGYEYVINAKEESTISAFNKTIDYVNNKIQLKKAQEKSMKIVKYNLNKFKESLELTFQTINQED
jgi:colanic acid/amylovoran biosynthesis protein